MSRISVACNSNECGIFNERWRCVVDFTAKTRVAFFCGWFDRNDTARDQREEEREMRKTITQTVRGSCWLRRMRQMQLILIKHFVVINIHGGSTNFTSPFAGCGRARDSYRTLIYIVWARCASYKCAVRCPSASISPSHEICVWRRDEVAMEATSAAEYSNNVAAATINVRCACATFSAWWETNEWHA